MFIGNNYMLRFALSCLLFCLSTIVKAQDNGSSNFEPRNNIGVYIGLIELNINYERNIIQKLNSRSNVRFGFGNGRFFVAGEGYYINPAFVHLIGKENSHLEIDLGIKYMISNSIADPKFSEKFIPDIFLGYRYEKATGGFTFRAGFNYPTIINLGIGHKF